MDNITQIRLRQDTKANWESVNPVLALGEPGVELDNTTGKVIGYKIGDGVSTWSTLNYQGADVSSLTITVSNLSNQVGTNTSDITTINNKLVTDEQNISTNQSNISNLQTTVANHTTAIQGATNRISLLENGLNTANNDISAEETRAKAAEQLLNSELDSEEIARANGDSALQQQINALSQGGGNSVTVPDYFTVTCQVSGEYESGITYYMSMLLLTTTTPVSPTAADFIGSDSRAICLGGYVAIGATGQSYPFLSVIKNTAEGSWDFKYYDSQMDDLYTGSVSIDDMIEPEEGEPWTIVQGTYVGNKIL